MFRSKLNNFGTLTKLTKLTKSAQLTIGLSSCLTRPDYTRSLFRGKALQYVEESLVQWLMSQGALVVMIPAVRGANQEYDRYARYAQYAQQLDGLVMHGGEDVWPGHYGELPMRPQWQGERLRDIHDLALVRAFFEAGKPIFGICRGLQLINVAFGGSLYQDISTQVPDAIMHRNAQLYDLHHHEVEIVPGSHFAHLFPKTEIALVNSVHHQAVKRLASDLIVQARSRIDGVVEALCHAQLQEHYVAAVQWHPEFRTPKSQSPQQNALPSAPLLQDFLSACCNNKKHA